MALVAPYCRNGNQATILEKSKILQIIFKCQKWERCVKSVSNIYCCSSRSSHWDSYASSWLASRCWPCCLCASRNELKPEGKLELTSWSLRGVGARGVNCEMLAEGVSCCWSSCSWLKKDLGCCGWNDCGWMDCCDCCWFWWNCRCCGNCCCTQEGSLDPQTLTGFWTADGHMWGAGCQPDEVPHWSDCNVVEAGRFGALFISLSLSLYISTVFITSLCMSSHELGWISYTDSLMYSMNASFIRSVLGLIICLIRRFCISINSSILLLLTKEDVLVDFGVEALELVADAVVVLTVACCWLWDPCMKSSVSMGSDAAVGGRSNLDLNCNNRNKLSLWHVMHMLQIQFSSK